jgi:hypothetical protein
MSKTSTDRVLGAFGSLKLSLLCLALLMVLVVACTLAQVRLGTFGAVNAYIRSPLVYWDLPDSDWSIPIFPGGALVGLVLAVNLIVAQARRLQLTWRKSGLWAVHAGLILLFAGEFVTGFFQKEMQLPIEQGETRDFVESPRDVEVAVVDATSADHDDAYGVPESLLLKGAPVPIAGTPLTLRVRGYLRNAELVRPGPEGPAPQATAGVGVDVAVQQKPPAANDDQPDNRAALIEPVADGTSYGTFLVSTGIAEPQRFVHKGRTYLLSMRFARQYLPYSVTLKKFSHDVYPGTDIPKNFSSLLHISNAQRGEERDVLVYMNQPLRYEGKAYYQASFGKGDTLSILQVVQNPGWLLPYVSCVLVGLGLCIHFALSLARSVRRRAGAAS